MKKGSPEEQFRTNILQAARCNLVSRVWAVGRHFFTERYAPREETMAEFFIHREWHQPCGIESFDVEVIAFISHTHDDRLSLRLAGREGNKACKVTWIPKLGRREAVLSATTRMPEPCNWIRVVDEICYQIYIPGRRWELALQVPKLAYAAIRRKEIAEKEELMRKTQMHAQARVARAGGKH